MFAPLAQHRLHRRCNFIDAKHLFICRRQHRLREAQCLRHRRHVKQSLPFFLQSPSDGHRARHFTFALQTLHAQSALHLPKGQTVRFAQKRLLRGGSSRRSRVRESAVKRISNCKESHIFATEGSFRLCLRQIHLPLGGRLRCCAKGANPPVSSSSKPPRRDSSLRSRMTVGGWRREGSRAVWNLAFSEHGITANAAYINAFPSGGRGTACGG